MKTKLFVQQLKKNDQEKLADFFLSLKPNTLFLWNRFGTHFSRAQAVRIATEQVGKPLCQEQGFVAYSDRELVGYCYLRFFPDKPQKKGTVSLGMVVRDSYQGCGVGTLMMKRMVAWAVAKKMRKIWLATYADNHLTENFYKKFGFIREGAFLFDEYFGRRPRHVISMAKFLDPKIHAAAKRLKLKLLKD